MRTAKKQLGLREYVPLIMSLCLFTILRFPSLFEPNWYGDEGIYQTIGLALRHGRLLYTGIFDNKPPLLYIVYAIFSGNQFEVRLFSLLIGLCTVTVFFRLTKRLFEFSKLPLILTLIFAALFALPLLEGNIANAENFMLLPILSAILLILSASPLKTDTLLSKKNLLFFSAGLLLAAATLYKIVGVFDTAACLLYLIFFHIARLTSFSKKHIQSGLILLVKDEVPVLIGYSIPLIITAGYFMIHHAFAQFIHAVLSSNVGYVGYNNTFIIPQGLLILKLLLLSLFLLCIFLKRRQLTLPMQFVLIWLGFSLFNVFFSQRPYTHYALLVIPSLILTVGFMFARLQARTFLLISLIALGTTFLHFGVYGRTLPYYGNFLAFVSGHKTVHDYEQFFDGDTPRDYDIVSFLKTQDLSMQSVFVWGDSAEIYPLTHTLPPGRYTVAYHITQYAHAVEETEHAIASSRPEYIVVLPNTSQIPFSLSSYMPLVRIDTNTIIYERTN